MKARRTFAQGAQLFSQLSIMERAGLPAATALATLHVPNALMPRVLVMQKLVAKGVDLASAGQRSALFTPFETDLLRAACMAGSPEPTFARLAADYERRAAHRSSVRAKMVLPCALLVLSLLIRPLPELVAGGLGVFGYLARTLLPLAAIFALARLSSSEAALRLRSTIAASLPLFGPMHERRSVRDLFQNLALLLEAGLPIATAFPIALRTIADPEITAQFKPVAPLLLKGTSLTDALQSTSFVGSADAIGFIRTGEASGTLPAMLQRFGDRMTDTINRFDALVAEWTPRLLYAAVALWMAWGLIRDTLALQTMPADL